MKQQNIGKKVQIIIRFSSGKRENHSFFAMDTFYIFRWGVKKYKNHGINSSIKITECFLNPSFSILSTILQTTLIIYSEEFEANDSKHNLKIQKWIFVLLLKLVLYFWTHMHTRFNFTISFLLYSINFDMENIKLVIFLVVVVAGC